MAKKDLEKFLDFDETWLPFSTKLSAFCYKIVVQSPQGLEFSINTHSFLNNGRFGLLIDLVVNTGGKNIIGNGNITVRMVGTIALSYPPFRYR